MREKHVKVIGIVAWLIAAFLAGFLFGSEVHAAEPLCVQRKTALKSLEKTFSEEPVSMGLASNGSVIEVLASPSGSFTIILTLPNGLSCVMASGENWENLPLKSKEIDLGTPL